MYLYCSDEKSCSHRQRQQIIIFCGRESRSLHQAEQNEKLVVLESAPKAELSYAILVKEPRNAVGGPLFFLQNRPSDPAEL
jgi:hypothetical protein